MKTLLVAMGTLLLGACSAMPPVQMSYGGAAGGTSRALSVNDDRLHHRAFYQDDDITPADEGRASQQPVARYSADLA